MLADQTSDVITHHFIKFTIIDRRGYLAMGFSHLVPELPFAIFNVHRLVARAADRQCASWIMDGLEDEIFSGRSDNEVQQGGAS